MDRRTFLRQTAAATATALAAPQLVASQSVEKPLTVLLTGYPVSSLEDQRFFRLYRAEDYEARLAPFEINLFLLTEGLTDRADDSWNHGGEEWTNCDDLDDLLAGFKESVEEYQPDWLVMQRHTSWWPDYLKLDFKNQLIRVYEPACNDHLFLTPEEYARYDSSDTKHEYTTLTVGAAAHAKALVKTFTKRSTAR